MGNGGLKVWGFEEGFVLVGRGGEFFGGGGFEMGCIVRGLW